MPSAPLISVRAADIGSPRGASTSRIGTHAWSGANGGDKFLVGYSGALGGASTADHAADKACCASSPMKQTCFRFGTVEGGNYGKVGIYLNEAG